MTEGTDSVDTHGLTEEQADVMPPPSSEQDFSEVRSAPETDAPDEAAAAPEPAGLAGETESSEVAGETEAASDPDLAGPQPGADAPEQVAAVLEPTEAEPTEDMDDVAAAIALADANVADEGSFDSIAPGTVAQDPEGAPQAEAALSVPQATTVSWIPFLIYDAIWLVFAGLIVWQFSELPVTKAIYESDLYTLAVLGGVVLAAVGPLLILAVWIGSWGKEGSRKGPLLVSSLIKGSVATLVGVVLWWGALLLLDQLRLGTLL